MGFQHCLADRKRLRESRRHSYSVENDHQEEHEDNKRVRIIHRQETEEENHDGDEEVDAEENSGGKSFWSSGSVRLISSCSSLSATVFAIIW